MCRRCGEPDRRGKARDRRARKAWLLTTFGDGHTCPCYWCKSPLTAFTLQQDRLNPGGPYRRDNLVPACARCNIARNAHRIPDGCEYGPVATTPALAGGR